MWLAFNMSCYVVLFNVGFITKYQLFFFGRIVFCIIACRESLQQRDQSSTTFSTSIHKRSRKQASKQQEAVHFQRTCETSFQREETMWQCNLWRFSILCRLGLMRFLTPVLLQVVQCFFRSPLTTFVRCLAAIVALASSPPVRYNLSLNVYRDVTKKNKAKCPHKPESTLCSHVQGLLF